MLRVEDFLAKHIEGYLFADVEAIIEYLPVAHPGAAGYPIVMSVCSGIEMLGLLMEGKPEQAYCEKNTVKYFGHYWKHYLSKVNPAYAKHTELARILVRNGLAHAFAAKPGIGVTRQGDLLHLQVHKGLFVINANCFYEDFKQSYLQHAKPQLFDNPGAHELAQQRLDEMLAQYEKESLRIFTEAKLLESGSGQITYTPSLDQIADENPPTTLSGMNL